MTRDALTLEEIRRLNAGQDVPHDYHAAVALLAAGRLEVVERTRRSLVIEVISRTDPARRYTLTAVDGRLACTCPAFVHRHRCAHSDAARLVAAPPGLRRLKPATDATDAAQTRLHNEGTLP